MIATSENPAVADINAREAVDSSVLKSRKQCQTEGGWGQTTQIAKEDSSALHRVNVGMSVKITSKSFYQHLRDLASAQPRKLRQPSARYQKRPRERTAAEFEVCRSATPSVPNKLESVGRPKPPPAPPNPLQKESRPMKPALERKSNASPS